MHLYTEDSFLFFKKLIIFTGFYLHTKIKSHTGLYPYWINLGEFVSKLCWKVLSVCGADSVPNNAFYLLQHAQSDHLRLSVILYGTDEDTVRRKHGLSSRYLLPSPKQSTINNGVHYANRKSSTKDRTKRKRC